MKKSLTKLIASCAAVAAVSTAMAVSASAATYEEGTVTTGITSAAADGAQATILVYKADSADTEATAESILYIDQQVKTADLWKTLSLTLEDGKYVIKMGGEGADVASEVLTVGAVVASGTGDVDNSGTVDVMDAVSIVNSIMGTEVYTDEQKALADTDSNGTVDVMDAVNVVSYITGAISSLPVA